mgnify:CR=1 FL=1
MVNRKTLWHFHHQLAKTERPGTKSSVACRANIEIGPLNRFRVRQFLRQKKARFPGLFRYWRCLQICFDYRDLVFLAERLHVILSFNGATSLRELLADTFTCFSIDLADVTLFDSGNLNQGIAVGL